MSVVDLQERQRGESSKVRVLAVGLLGVIRTCANSSGEVADLHDVIVWQEQSAQLLEVQPLVRGPLDSAVVQVEPVYVDDRPWTSLHPGYFNGAHVFVKPWQQCRCMQRLHQPAGPPLSAQSESRSFRLCRFGSSAKCAVSLRCWSSVNRLRRADAECAQGCAEWVIIYAHHVGMPRGRYRGGGGARVWPGSLGTCV